jgi:hypothetical protein
MDLEAEILREHSRRQIENIADWIGPEKRRFNQLMDLFLKGDYRVTQRSAWAVSCCAERHPYLAIPWLQAMIKKMREPGVHIAVKRNVLHILERIDIPLPLLGSVVTICFEELGNPNSAIAVRVYSMSILLKVAETEPDLQNELRLMIEQVLPHAGPAIRARAKRVLCKLQKGTMSENRKIRRARLPLQSPQKCIQHSQS